MKLPISIILVDDDRITNFLHERLLKKMNVTEEIVVLNNGREALIYLEEVCKRGAICPSLILLDLNMPIIDGFEFLKQFKLSALYRNIKIVVVTTSNSERDINKIKTLGEFNLINKPLTEEKLKAIIK